MLSILLLPLALAQAPAAPGPLAPPSLLPTSPTVPPATHTLAREVELNRWPDQPSPVGSLPAGSPVNLVVLDGDRARIRHGVDYGWVPADALVPASPSR